MRVHSLRIIPKSHCELFDLNKNACKITIGEEGQSRRKQKKVAKKR